MFYNCRNDSANLHICVSKRIQIDWRWRGATNIMEKKKQKIRQISCGSFRPYFHWNVVVAFNSIWNYIGMYSFQLNRLFSINSHFGLNSFRQFRKSIVNRTTERGMNDERKTNSSNNKYQQNENWMRIFFLFRSAVYSTTKQKSNALYYCYGDMLF